jgi:hypothetical protein
MENFLIKERKKMLQSLTEVDSLTLVFLDVSIAIDFLQGFAIRCRFADNVV